MRTVTVEDTLTHIRVLMAIDGHEQADLADWLGVSQPAISRKLAGRTEFTTTELVALATRFAASDQRLHDAIHGSLLRTYKAPYTSGDDPDRPDGVNAA